MNIWLACFVSFCAGNLATVGVFKLYSVYKSRLPVKRVDIDVLKGLGHACGALEASGNIAALGEDMYEIELHNGIVIDAGWYYRDDNGRGMYFITVCDGMKVIREVTTSDVYQAKQNIEQLVLEFSEE